MTAQTSSAAVSPRYVVLSKTTQMPSSCMGAHAYRRMALLEIEPGLSVADIRMISTRARGVVRIVREYDRVYVGATTRSYGVRLLQELRAEAAKLNASC